MVSATFLVLEKREKFFFVLSFQSLEIKFGAQPDLFVFISFPGIEKKLEQDFVGAEGQHGIGKLVQFESFRMAIYKQGHISNKVLYRQLLTIR